MVKPSDPLNVYGDARCDLAGGHGIDIASQRLDPLDLQALEHLRHLLEQQPATPPLVLDLGCGAGGMLEQLVSAGAEGIGVDRADVQAAFEQRAARVGGGMRFMQADFARLPDDFCRLYARRVSLVVCQRALHYLTYEEANRALHAICGLLRPEGRLFIGVSGMTSELSEGYPARQNPIERRWSLLAPVMRDKHAICQPVCLYDAPELSELLNTSGFCVETLFTSPFGNLKAVASPKQD